MKYLQESRKSSYFAAALLGAVLVALPLVAAAQGPQFAYTESSQGKSVNAVNSTPYTDFNATLVNMTMGSTQFNFVGTGGHDTFTFNGTAGANSNETSLVYLATGSLLNGTDNFVINGTGNANFSTFSLMTGSFSNFTIGQTNYNGTATFAITGGANCTLIETGGNYTAQIHTTFYSINLGTNSSVILGSDFQGNASTVNVVF